MSLSLKKNIAEHNFCAIVETVEFEGHLETFAKKIIFSVSPDLSSAFMACSLESNHKVQNNHLQSSGIFKKIPKFLR